MVKIKPWSISTTVRNPERLVDFLKVLKQLEGDDFDTATQVKYQIMLIQHRLYTPTIIPDKYITLFKDVIQEIPFEVAQEVFETQNYVGPDMRGRQSVNPLNKLGFSVAVERLGAVHITNLGNLLLATDSKVSYIFFKSLLKLQFPNPMSAHFSEKKGFNICPFIAVLHLIKKTSGLSQEEFSLFVPTLANFKDIDKYSGFILKRRTLKSSKTKKEFDVNFLKNFYKTDALTKTQWNNPFEYGDNTMRYFRLTKYFRVEKHALGHWKINLEPSRMKEIDQLLNMYDGAAQEFKDVVDYVKYISDINEPKLPWEMDFNKSKDIFISLLDIVRNDYKTLNSNLQTELKKEYVCFNEIDLKKLDLKQTEKFIEMLRSFRLKILHLSRSNFLRKNINELKRIVSLFKDRQKMKKVEPVEFEYMISQCFKILNDEIEIKPNCIIDDDGSPIGFAPGNKADIEGYYHSFNGIFEVTLDVSRNQVYRESIPIMRHLKEFENNNPSKPAFCVFIAPKVHDDTVNYLWISVKHGFEGRKQKIVALDLNNFLRILEIFIVVIEQGKTFNHGNIESLLNSIVTNGENENSSVNWFRNVSSNIQEWEASLI
ncbi:MAG: AlwI family type II restriction endonuclease [Planctomycetaceae bacterium]|nr:AlwI family type II restriction endonuclease [Planctomycetaceae bacterium]